jgi:hypothetical protein
MIPSRAAAMIGLGVEVDLIAAAALKPLLGMLGMW